MQYSEDAIADLMTSWNKMGYDDIIIIDHGMLFAKRLQQHFSVAFAREDHHVYVHDDYNSGMPWSLHAVTISNYCKGIMILGESIYQAWELTSQIRSAFSISCSDELYNHSHDRAIEVSPGCKQLR